MYIQTHTLGMWIWALIISEWFSFFRACNQETHKSMGLCTWTGFSMVPYRPAAVIASNHDKFS